MRDKPRRRDESIISKPMAIQILVMSVWLIIMSIAWFKVPFFASLFENEAQHYSAYFCLFVFSFMVNAFNVRSEGPNIFEHIKENTMFVKIWVVIMLVQVVLASIGGVVGEIFSCVRFGITGWIVIFIMALTMYPVDLIRKAIMRK